MEFTYSNDTKQLFQQVSDSSATKQVSYSSETKSFVRD
jgi:hypothetical protein